MFLLESIWTKGWHKLKYGTFSYQLIDLDFEPLNTHTQSIFLVKSETNQREFIAK